MENVKQHSSFIRRIVTAPTPIRAKLLKTSNQQIITAIAEIIHNIIQKNIKVPTRALSNLKKFKRVYYRLVAAKPSTRKDILIQNPNCLPPLAPLFK